MSRALATLALASLLFAGCVNPYCGANGEPCCGSAGECGPTLTCADGVCGRPCDVYANDCPPDGNCVWTSSGAGTCVAVGSLGFGASCSNGAACARGLICAAHPDQSGGTCGNPCLDPSSCGAGQSCIPISLAAGDTRATCR